MTSPGTTGEIDGVAGIDFSRACSIEPRNAAVKCSGHVAVRLEVSRLVADRTSGKK